MCRSKKSAKPWPVRSSSTSVTRMPLKNEPLEIAGIDVQTLPFYALNARFKELDNSRQYLLYCDKGVMSRLHAHHLLSEGHANVRVYRPS